MNCDLWALSPEQLASRLPERSPTATFSRLQHSFRWGPSGPLLGLRTRCHLSTFGMDLPQVVETRRAADGSVKVLLAYESARVEAIYMPREVKTSRVTICLSSQVGCAMGCTFCATAQLGFTRHLTAGEIVAQVLVVVWKLGPRHPSDLTLVFMGMGEPLHNLPQVKRAVEILCHPRGLGLSPRRITVSTVGLVPAIQELATFPVRPLLAVSLNATTDEQRSQLMPIGHKYSIKELRRTLEAYPLRPGERFLVEYVLMAKVNDSEEDAARLHQFVHGLPCQLNLIPYNDFPGSGLTAPSETQLNTFAGQVLSHGRVILTVRRSRGRDVSGACGQLAASVLS